MLTRLLLILLFSIACLFYLYGFSKPVSNKSVIGSLEPSPTVKPPQTDCSNPCKRPPLEENNKPPDVTDLTLNQTEVAASCPSGQVPQEGMTCDDKMTVQVTTKAVDPEKDVVMYHYTVSGGRIVGQGANVYWNLSGIAPGTYTITAGVDDGCGICGQTQTRTITIRSCSCVIPVMPIE
ncbi:MAG: hypothetical protein M3367_04085 [Acidobacteriota bacterium]|nr:hypothetical protein [Acidobacteriota bacterium]